MAPKKWINPIHNHGSWGILGVLNKGTNVFHRGKYLLNGPPWQARFACASSYSSALHVSGRAAGRHVSHWADVGVLTSEIYQLVVAESSRIRLKQHENTYHWNRQSVYDMIQSIGFTMKFSVSFLGIFGCPFFRQVPRNTNERFSSKPRLISGWSVSNFATVLLVWRWGNHHISPDISPTCYRADLAIIPQKLFNRDHPWSSQVSNMYLKHSTKQAYPNKVAGCTIRRLHLSNCKTYFILGRNPPILALPEHLLSPPSSSSSSVSIFVLKQSHAYV